MAGFDDPAFYGDRWAAVYDDHHVHMDPGPAVEFLAGLAGDGRAGLRLTERHADWDRRPFTSASDGHVSVYQRA